MVNELTGAGYIGKVLTDLADRLLSDEKLLTSVSKISASSPDLDDLINAVSSQNDFNKPSHTRSKLRNIIDSKLSGVDVIEGNGNIEERQATSTNCLP